MFWIVCNRFHQLPSLNVYCVSYSVFNWRIIALSCCVRFCISINQPCVYMSSHPLKPPRTPHPTARLSAVTERQAELPVLDSSLPPAICSTHGNVYVSVLFSQFIPLSFLPRLYPQVCSVCLCLYSWPANCFISTIISSMLHINIQYLFFSDFTL